MRPTKVQVLHLLDQASQDPKNLGWIKHSLSVGDIAKFIADTLNRAGQHLDANLLQLMGYLHDYGKIVDYSTTHPTSGYYQLKKLGYDEVICAVSLTHHYINNDPTCTLCTLPDPVQEKFLIEYIKNHEFTLSDQIIGFCDSVCTLRPTTLENRIVDCISRHGTCSGTQKRIQAIIALKSQLDQMLGFNLYQLYSKS